MLRGVRIQEAAPALAKAEALLEPLAPPQVISTMWCSMTQTEGNDQLLLDRAGVVRLTAMAEPTEQRRWRHRDFRWQVESKESDIGRFAIEPIHGRPPCQAAIIDGSRNLAGWLYEARATQDVRPLVALLPDTSPVYSEVRMVRRGTMHVRQTWWHHDREIGASIMVPVRLFRPHGFRWAVAFSPLAETAERRAVLAILLRKQYVDWYSE